MSDKIPLKATFEAFRKRERSGVLFQATAAFLLIAFIVIGWFVWANFSAFGEIAGWYAQIFQSAASGKFGGAPPMPPSALLGVIPSYFLLLYLVGVFVLYIISAGVIGVMAASSLAALGLTATPEQIFPVVTETLMSPTGLLALIVLYLAYLALAAVFYISLFGVNARAVIVAREAGKLPS